MFGPGRIATARRCLLALGDSRPLRALFRCLRHLPFPGLVSLLLFWTLYSIAEYKFTDRYFALGDVWKPAFPWSWRALFLALFVVPAFSFCQLAWLVLGHVVLARRGNRYGGQMRGTREYSVLLRSEPSSLELEERRMLGVRDEEERELEDGCASRFHSPCQRSDPRHPLSLVSSPRFMLWFALFCTSLWLGLRYQQPEDVRYRPQIEKASAHPKRAGYANQGATETSFVNVLIDGISEKIFIASMFYNNEKVIPYWSDSIIKAIHYLGEDNVFVSIVESESGDKSPALLRQLDDKLGAMGVQRRILTGDKAVTKPESLEGNNRISYLSALRNRVLEPLVEMGGYDKVMFSNDIYIEPETILELLYTAEGEYDMACGMDYGHFG